MCFALMERLLGRSGSEIFEESELYLVYASCGA